MPIESRDWVTLSHLLDSALAMSAEERATWIDGLDPQYEAFKGVLRDLLSRQDLIETSGFLATLPKVARRAVQDSKPDAVPGDVIGAYRVERLLGTGGMGSVWLAERADALIKRHVALKLPHGGGALIERMARERDILAALEHPNIARLYDAGVAQDGRPFLALEFVEGQPIDAWCGERSADLHTRIMLIIEVARAVAYAHAHLVVHRDLKPSNILVDAQGHARLLDFGIGKLLYSGAAPDAALTQAGGVGLTPEYASPEQIRGAAVSTASDIYSLGVVAYELLTGVRPHSRGNDADPFALAQAIISHQPRRPSEAVADRARQRALRGDLDVIVIKALKKTPEERYATMAEFADDLERCLRGEPVRARPDSLWYRTRRFVGRNKLGVGTGVVVLLALAAGGALTLWQARVARSEARTSQAVQQFLEDLFRKNSSQQDNPGKARATTARELLALGSKSIRDSLQDEPEARLRVLATLADMNQDLSLYDEAVALNRERVATARALYGSNDVRVADALLELSKSMIGSRAVDERKGVLDETLAILDRAGEHGTRRRSTLLAELYWLYSAVDSARALALAEERLKLERSFGPSKSLVEALLALGSEYNTQQRFAEGEVTLTEAMQMSRQVLGAHSEELLQSYGYLADSQQGQHKIAPAERSLREALRIAQEKTGPESESSQQVALRLGRLLSLTARIEEGTRLLGHATEMTLRARGADDPIYTPTFELMYAQALIASGRIETGLDYVQRAGKIWEKYQQDAQNMAAPLETEAGIRLMFGEFAACEALLDRAAGLRKQAGSEREGVSDALATRVALLLLTRRTADAAAALAGAKPVTTRSSLQTLKALLTRAEIEYAAGHAAQAGSLAAQAYDTVRVDPDRAYLKNEEARAAYDLALAKQRLAARDEATVLLRATVELRTGLYDPATSLLLADSYLALAGNLFDSQGPDAAREALAHAGAILAAHPRLGPQYRVPLATLEARLRNHPVKL